MVHRVGIRGKNRDNGSHGGQQKNIRSRGRESQEDQRRSVQGAPREKETRRDAQDARISAGVTVEKQKNDLDRAVEALRSSTRTRRSVLCRQCSSRANKPRTTET